MTAVNNNPGEAAVYPASRMTRCIASLPLCAGMAIWGSALNLEGNGQQRQSRRCCNRKCRTTTLLGYVATTENSEYRDNGKQTETAVAYWAYVGTLENEMETTTTNIATNFSSFSSSPRRLAHAKACGMIVSARCASGSTAKPYRHKRTIRIAIQSSASQCARGWS